LDLKIVTLDQNKILFEQNNVVILFKISKFWFQWNSLGCFKALSNILLHPTHLPTCIFFFSFLKFKKKSFTFEFCIHEKISHFILFHNICYPKTIQTSQVHTPNVFFFFSGEEFLTIANLILKKEYFVARFLYFEKKKSSNKKVKFWVRFATFLILAIIGSKTIKGNCFLEG